MTAGSYYVKVVGNVESLTEGKKVPFLVYVARTQRSDKKLSKHLEHRYVGPLVSVGSRVFCRYGNQT